METHGSDRALRVFNILNGKFFAESAGEHTRGFKMIYGMIMVIKSTCVEFIPKIYTGIVDQFVMGCPPHSIVRKVLGGLFLPFLIFMFLFHLHVSKGLLPHLKDNKDLWELFYFSFLVITVVNFAVLMITRAHDLNNKEDRVQVEDLVKNDSYLSQKSARCSRCEIPNVLRSFHCPPCDMHVAKYHEHSRTLNKCIGAGNLLPYVSFQFFLFVFFFFGALFIRLPKAEGFTQKRGIKFLNNIMYLCYLCFAFGRFMSFVKNLACIYFNITMHETTYWPQLGYLWKNPRKEFFNPFDKGAVKNIKEEIYTTINHEDVVQNNLNETNEEMNLRDNLEDPEEKERKAILEERTKIRNWRTEKLINITSIYSSPMRKIFLEFINKKKQKKPKNKEGSDSDSDE